VEVAATATRGQEKLGAGVGEKQTPPHTLPDIFLPILPVVNDRIPPAQIPVKENGASARVNSRPGKVEEILQDRLHRSPNQLALPAVASKVKSDPGAKAKPEALAPPVPAALKQFPKIPEALLERNYLSDRRLTRQVSVSAATGIKLEVKDEVKVTKKVIDYRNDPRYKKKKTKSSSSVDSKTSTNEPGNGATAGEDVGASNGMDSSLDSISPVRFSSKSIVEPPSQFFTSVSRSENATSASQSGGDAKRSLTNEDKARQVISLLLHEERDVSPTTPSSEHILVPSFQSTNPTLVGASGHYIDEDDEDEDEDLMSDKPTLKAMFKTIDPTTSPFC